MMQRLSTDSPTAYPDINVLLSTLADGITTLCSDNLIGLYLTGSLSYGDFDPKRSDIDLFAIVQNAVSPNTLEKLKTMHQQVEIQHPNWTTRIECQYVPIDFFASISPPETPRPWLGDGKFYDEADYGNEWIINNYLLYAHSITLIGPEFSSLIDPIDIREVQKACIRDVFREWQPKITDTDYLENSHNQSYVVLNLCRILYTVLHGKAGSKKQAATWVMAEFPECKDLIQAADAWGYGDAMGMQDKTVEFIRFAVEKVSATDLFAEIKSP